jgi:hypothetical protein
MPEIAALNPEGTSTQGNAPKSWSAKLCLCACLGLFAVVASMMSGFDAMVVEALSACLADWRIPAGIILGVALVGVVGFVMYWLPSLLELAFLALLAALVPYLWFKILTAATPEGVHLVSIPLVSGMIVASVLFAACASLHFGPVWGRSKIARLYTGFLVGSAVTLAFTSVVTMVAFDNFEAKALAAAETSFRNLHPGQKFVRSAIVEMSGYKFECLINMRDVSCGRTSN